MKQTQSKLVYFAKAISSNKPYQNTKNFFKELLNSKNSKKKFAFDLFIISLVIFSISALLIGVTHTLPPYIIWLEDFAIGVFICEYILRVWVYNDIHKIILKNYEEALFLNLTFIQKSTIKEIILSKIDYMKTPMAIVDLLAIIPSYRPLRILRIFLLFRLFKLFRYARSVNEFMKVLSEKRFEIYTLGIFAGFVIFFSSSAIYIFEGGSQQSHINNFFDAIYWSFITLSTVGYGDIIPTSAEGRFITLILIIAGVAVISFFTSIIVSAFSEKLEEIRTNSSIAQVEKLTDYYILCGFGRMGKMVSSFLKQKAINFVVLDLNHQIIDEAKKLGYHAIVGDASDDNMLKDLGIQNRAKGILTLLNDDVTNVFITLTARGLNKNIKIISKANSASNQKKLLLAGANDVITPYESISTVISGLVFEPVAFEALYKILSGTDKNIIDLIYVSKEFTLCNKQLNFIDWKKRRLIIFGVVRNNKLNFNPKEDFILEDRDSIIVFGHKKSIELLKKVIKEDSI